MNRYFNFLVIFITIALLLVNCTVRKSLQNYDEEKIIISFGQNTDKRPDFNFNSNDDKLICIGFLDKFNDTIITYLNNKPTNRFYRTGNLTYKDLKNDEIFKIIPTEIKENNKISIFLKNEEKRISFDLVKGKKLYLISHYGTTWYLSIWD
ncbi:MAG TPA: hypothetical protein VK623_00255 [Flavobacterium sp.]|nr:hypothetical protein [Flavobacterium sp.]